jgi:hypothetical protein
MLRQREQGVALKTCEVSYSDTTCKYSVEVMAETLYEAIVLGIKAMNVRQDTLHLKSFNVLIKQPEVYREISGAALSAWLARPGKNPKEQLLKQRLREILLT